MVLCFFEVFKVFSEVFYGVLGFWGVLGFRVQVCGVGVWGLGFWMKKHLG